MKEGKMFIPNLYTLRERGSHYGLHKFPDGILTVAVQHECGDWITISRPTDAQIRYFEQHGAKVEKNANKS
jgi:hypothetical protein